MIGGPHLPGKYRVTNRKDLQPETGQFRTDFEADLSTKFVEENREKPFFLMISPQTDSRDHLTILRKLAKVGRNTHLCRLLMEAEDLDEIAGLLSELEEE